MTEHEELARVLESQADQCAEMGMDGWAQFSRRAAALLREARPQPGWRPMHTAPKDGTEVLASDYDAIEIVNWSWEAWGSRDGSIMFPAWWQPLPEHPPIPTEPTETTND